MDDPNGENLPDLFALGSKDARNSHSSALSHCIHRGMDIPYM